MKLLIMRHGQAEPYAGSDAERQLTDYGREQARAAGQYLRDNDFSFDQMWVSPYVRAQQTSEQVLAILGDTPVQTRGFIVPESSPISVAVQLAEANVECLMIVSHQPLVSALVGVLTQANVDTGPAMGTASMALIEADNHFIMGCCDLQWVRHAPFFERE